MDLQSYPSGGLPFSPLNLLPFVFVVDGAHSLVLLQLDAQEVPAQKMHKEDHRL